jgi:hypothetical protein
MNEGMDIECCDESDGTVNICWDKKQTRLNGDMCLNYISIVGTGKKIVQIG